ncbi:MAG: hypothetical protein AAF974_01180 [Cyanobacteria bacterium P01_E01_bin.34]
MQDWTLQQGAQATDLNQAKRSLVSQSSPTSYGETGVAEFPSSSVRNRISQYSTVKSADAISLVWVT